MGPFIQMPAAPNKWEALAESFKQGIQKGSDIFLQSKLQTMLEDQQTRRNEQMNLQAFGKGYGGIDPKVASALRKMELEYGDQEGIEDVFNKMHNIDGGEGIGGRGVDPTSRVGQALQGFGQEPTEPPPGQDMMLPYEDMPAEETFVQPRAIEGSRKAIPEQQMSPSQNYRQRINQLNKDFKDAYSQLKGAKARKDLRSMYNSEMQAIERQRANDIAEGRLSQGKEKLQLEREKSEIGKTREEEQKNTQDFINRSKSNFEEIPYQQNLLNIAKRSIGEDNFGLLSPDQLADWTHIEAFRTPEGETFRTSVKEYFLNDIKRAGSRPNQFIEKMISNILPSVGKNYKANMVWAEMQQMKIDLDKARQQIIQQLKPQYQDQYGKPLPALVDAVNNEMMAYGDKIQDKTAYRIQEVMEHKASSQDLRSTKSVTPGTPLTASRAKELTKIASGDTKKAIAAAKKLGYKIIDRNILNEQS
jgi:hypothetical protein